MPDIRQWWRSDPSAAPVAVLTPSVIEDIWLAAGGELSTHAGTELKVFQVDCNVNGQVLPLWP